MRSSASPFGGFRVRIDSWEVDYGDQTPLISVTEEAEDSVDPSVEVVEENWRVIVPVGEMAPQGRVVFVDGVRRLEARLQARAGERLVVGGFGSFAVGAAVVETSLPACFGEVRVSRSVVMGSGACLPGPVRVRSDLSYEAESTSREEGDAPLRHIQDSMRQAEAALARELCREGTLVIVDGPLSFEPERRGAALGYIKRIHKLYLPARLLPLLAALPAGGRTPLFLIQKKGSGFTRYSWFQRLAAPGPGSTELHGVVRLEVASDVGIEAARTLANAATTWLPRLAPSRARDPRSPQNLLPIGALEQKLRAASGNATLFRRWIETLVVEEALRDTAPGRSANSFSEGLT